MDGPAAAAHIYASNRLTIAHHSGTEGRVRIDRVDEYLKHTEIPEIIRARAPMDFQRSRLLILDPNEPSTTS